MRNIYNRTIYVNDNLNILRGINSGTVDMIYLDPPFNSKKQWSAPIGSISAGAVFKDTWHENDIKDEWVEEIKGEHPALHSFLSSMKLWADKSDVAYITYMSIRMIECHRILKETGTLWYHCDHYMNDLIKIMLDIIFGRGHDINNIVWCYRTGGVTKKHFGKKHDNIFFYAKTKDYKYNSIKEKSYLTGVDKNKKNVGGGFAGGKTQFFNDDKGWYTMAFPRDWWVMDAIHNTSKERLGYPTQKPLRLMRKIIEASTDKNDLILDPFCGSATTCVAAEELGRQWVGIDISAKAGEVVNDRINKQIDGKIDFELREMVPINVESLPPRRSENDEESKGKYVYIISNTAFTDEFKVGIASDWKKRLGGYQTSDPNRGYKCEYKILTPKYREIEKAVHDHFDNRHEWVRATKEDIINFIENYE